MDIDFARVNLEYLMHARDLARQDIGMTATLLSIPPELARLFAESTPEELVQIVEIKVPLLLPRQESWWWERLFKALRDHRTDELQAIIEHASLMSVQPPRRD